MPQLYKIHSMVEKTLVEKPFTRDSDEDLYIEVCNAICPEAMQSGFAFVLKNRAALGLPNYESVGRCRRKLQEHNPLLRASKKADDARYESFKEYLDYVSD